MVRLLTVTNVAAPLLSRTNSSAKAALALAQSLRRRASTGNMPEKNKRVIPSTSSSSPPIPELGANSDDSSISSTDSENEDLLIEGRDDFQMTTELISSSSSLSALALPSCPALPQALSNPPLVVEEEIFTTCDMSLLGSIEIQLVKDPARPRKIIQRLRITCFPSCSGCGGGEMMMRPETNEDTLYNSDADAAIAGHDYHHEPQPSMMDHFASTFMESCAVDIGDHVVASTPKSALRSRHLSSHHNALEYPDDAGLEKKYSVSFDKVDIHEFMMTLGDHPSAASGPPVAIDWEHKANVNCLNLDEYERSRPARRSRKDLKLSLRDRKGILLGEGRFSNQEVHMAWQEARNIRKQRRETLRRGVFLMVYDDMIESASRKMSRLADSMLCFSC